MNASQPGFDAARHLEAMAQTLGLTITAEQRPGVLQFLALAQAMAEMLRTAPHDDASFELAPVFHPGEHGEGERREA